MDLLVIMQNELEKGGSHFSRGCRCESRAAFCSYRTTGRYASYSSYKQPNGSHFHRGNLMVGSFLFQYLPAFFTAKLGSRKG
jgi:hypothetical protein